MKITDSHLYMAAAQINGIRRLQQQQPHAFFYYYSLRNRVFFMPVPFAIALQLRAGILAV